MTATTAAVMTIHAYKCSIDISEGTTSTLFLITDILISYKRVISQSHVGSHEIEGAGN